MGDYYKTKESVEEYIRLADGYNGQNLIDKLLRFLPEGSDLLELGSGPGTDWRILKKHYQVTGSDNSAEFLSHLIKTNPSADFLQLDAVTLETEMKFEGVYSNKVLHHLKDEELEASIQRQHQILQPEGIVCHSFWLGEGTEVFKGLFVNYQNEDSLGVAFGGKFDILTFDTYEEFEPEDSLLVIARRKN